MFSIVGIALSSVLLSAPAAQAETRSGDVTIAWPSTIVLDGSPIPLTVSSSALTGYSDKVWVDLYNGTDRQGVGQVAVSKQGTISSYSLKPGSITARGSLATTYCSLYSSDICSYDSNFNRYTFVNGLTYRDSAPATAKYASAVSLAATNDGSTTTWTASASRYGDHVWVPWAGAAVSIGSTTLTADANGVATWVEPTSTLHTLTATAAESATVWGSASSAVTAVAKPAVSNPVATTPKPVVSAKPGHVSASATASKAASALKKGMPTVRKVVKLTKRNDVNKLLGRSNGYTSAAVLYDKRLSCSSGPGVDCGATIEKFTTTAKAKARAKHIQTLLKRYSFLGTEYETVHGHFLLRVSGDLTHAQAAKYRSAFTKSFK